MGREKVTYILFTDVSVKGGDGDANMANASESEDNSNDKTQSSDEFPEDLFSQEQRTHGAILVHLFVLAYCFLLVSFICQDYFLPAVFRICTGIPKFPLLFR